MPPPLFCVDGFRRNTIHSFVSESLGFSPPASQSGFPAWAMEFGRENSGGGGSIKCNFTHYGS